MWVTNNSKRSEWSPYLHSLPILTELHCDFFCSTYRDSVVDNVSAAIVFAFCIFISAPLYFPSHSYSYYSPSQTDSLLKGLWKSPFKERQLFINSTKETELTTWPYSKKNWNESDMQTDCRQKLSQSHNAQVHFYRKKHNQDSVTDLLADFCNNVGVSTDLTLRQTQHENYLEGIDHLCN